MIKNYDPSKNNILRWHRQVWDLNDDLDMYWLHEAIMFQRYHNMKDTSSKLDLKDRTYFTKYRKLFYQKANQGSWEFARPTVALQEKHIPFNEYKYRDPDDNILYWDRGSKYTMVYLVSFAGHEGRLSWGADCFPESISKTKCNMLIVNEDPFRMPEYEYPSCFILGNSQINPTWDKLIAKLKAILDEYSKDKIVFLYADSKHAGSGIGMAGHLGLQYAFIIHGQNTYDWDNNPWVQHWLKKKNIDNLGEVQQMAIVKAWRNRKRDTLFTDPLQHLSEWPNLRIDYYYGAYDVEYEGFADYLADFVDGKQLIAHQVDFRFSPHDNGHFIRTFVDREILPVYMSTLT